MRSNQVSQHPEFEQERSMPTATTHPAAYTGRLRTRAVVAVIGYWLWVAGLAASVALAAVVVLDQSTGRPSISDHQINLVLGPVTIAVLGSSVFLAAALPAWTWRARRNAEVLSDFPYRTSARWALFGWFVPYANLVVPVLVVADVVRASGLRRPGAATVRLWWAANIGWMAVWGLSFAAALLGPVAYVVATLAVVGTLVLAAVCFTRIALGVAAAQDRYL
jgi:hypothetical protein